MLPTFSEESPRGKGSKERYFKTFDCDMQTRRVEKKKKKKRKEKGKGKERGVKAAAAGIAVEVLGSIGGSPEFPCQFLEGHLALFALDDLLG